MDLSNDIVAKSIIASTDKPYRYKDAKKFKNITKLIAAGKPGTSAEAYAKALRSITNTKAYHDKDIVGVSVNGGLGSRRQQFNTQELMLALQARATIITDNETNRNRPNNTGERELAEFLEAMGYVEESGVWKPTNV